MHTFKEYFHNSFLPNYQLLLERCEPPLKILQKYKDDDNAFLSFTGDVEPRGQKSGQNLKWGTFKPSIEKKGTKIGINPKSKYNTPIGVYFYPIKAFWDNLEKGDIPFAGDNRHLYIVKAKNYDKLLIGSKYSADDLAKDIEKLEEIYPHIDFTDIIENILDNYKRTDAQTFWSVTRELAHILSRKVLSRVPVIWTQIFRTFYDGVVDDTGEGFIHSNEPTQAVIWTKAQFDTLDYIDKKCGSRKTMVGWNSSIEISEAWRILKVLQNEDHLNEKKQKFKDRLIEIISTDPKYVFEYIRYYIDLKTEEIPAFLIDTLIKSVPRSLFLIEQLIQVYIDDDIEYDNIPKKLLEKVSEKAESAFNVLQYMLRRKFTLSRNMPELLIKSISESSYYSFLLAENALDITTVPEIILKKLAEISSLAYKIAAQIIEYPNTYGLHSDVPEVLIQSISKDRHNSMEYARLLFGRNDYKLNPDDIPKNMLKTLSVSFLNVISMIDMFGVDDMNKIPDELFEHLYNDAVDARIFIEEFLKKFGVDKINKIPNKLFELISKDPISSRLFTEMFLREFGIENLDKIPNTIIDSIYSDSYNRQKYQELIDSYEQKNNITESFQLNQIDADRAYEIFNQEYLQSTGKSWNRNKFLNRSQNWTFWGDDDGFITTRSQKSGFVKLVGAAGSNKSKYKGFRELASTNLPVWGMVDSTIASMLKKLGYRGSNMIERIALQGLLKSGKMNSVIGNAEIVDVSGDKITIKYPDIGTVEKYFVGSSAYWKLARTKIFNK